MVLWIIPFILIPGTEIRHINMIIFDVFVYRVNELQKEIEMLRTDRKKLQDKVSTLEGNLKIERMRGEVNKMPSSKGRSGK